jgi:hypothetical protein
MGGGESHKGVWNTWWDERGFDEAGALDYFRRWGVHDAWLAWAGHAVWPAIDWEDDAAAARRMEVAGIGRYDDWEKAFNMDPL